VPDQPTATLSTNRGDVVVTLFSDFSPKTVRNFIELAQGTEISPGHRELHDPGRLPPG
jgi:cyclophilin family peptidyl-prolyl cis-trans isomerase